MFGFKGHNEPIQEEWGIFIFQPRLWHFRMLIQRCPDQLNGFEGFFWAFLLLSYLANSQGCSTTTVWPSPLIVFSGWGGWQNLMLMWAMWAVYVLVMEGSCQARTWNFGDPVATLEVKIPQLAQAPSLHPSFAPSSAWTRSAWKARHTFFSCSFVFFFRLFCVFRVGFLRKVHVGTWCFSPRASGLPFSSRRQRHAIWPEKQVALRDLASLFGEKMSELFQQRNEMTTTEIGKARVFFILLGETFGVCFLFVVFCVFLLVFFLVTKL